MSITFQATPIFRRRRMRWQALQFPLSATILLALSEGLVHWAAVPEYILPPPSAIVVSLVHIVEAHFYIRTPQRRFSRRYAASAS
jgi:ABC-type nitrate/sulfonate/bicarbonate transport system permease component